MIRLADSLEAWDTPAFNETLKAELEQLDGSQLPLQQGLTTASHALDNNLSALIIHSRDDGDFIRAKAGIFYTGIIAGCACADDPTPVNEETEYCLVQIDIDKATGEASVALLSE